MDNDIAKVKNKLNEILDKRRCSDIHCIWGHNKVGTNGGCQHLKMDRVSAAREMRQIAKDIRNIIDEI